MNDEGRHSAQRWRTIVAAVLTCGAAGVTVFACMSGPSSAAPTSDNSSMSGTALVEQK